MFRRANFKQKHGPERPSVAEYLKRMASNWDQLLLQEPDEKPVQEFLESHPMMVPGARTPSGGFGHEPMLNSLIAEPQLPGLTGPRPDFMWIPRNSLKWFPTFIEIESPRKRIFRKDGTPTAEFTQARNQLSQWRAWFGDPGNVSKFISTYGIEERMLKRATMHLHMILVYGRRSEFEHNPILSKQRGALLPGPDEELMSFDRLAPEVELDRALTLQCIDHGRYRVKVVPTVFGFTPEDGRLLDRVDGMEEAIDAMTDIEPERKEFLKERARYWLDWHRNGEKGLSSLDYFVE